MKLESRTTPGVYIVLSTRSITLGRDAANDLVIDAQGVSDFHAEISCVQGSYLVEDLLSANGTYVNGTRVTGRQPLAAWDVLQLGAEELELNDPSVERPSAWRLRIRQGNDEAWHNLTHSVCIGRDADCDITLEHELISRRHVTLQLVSGGVSVEDMNSANGTYLNGRRVHNGHAYSGDELLVEPFAIFIEGPQPDLQEAGADARTMLKDELEPPVTNATEILGPGLSTAYLHDQSQVLTNGPVILRGAPMVLGRAESCDVVLPDASVSKVHADLIPDGRTWKLMDKNSSNGVFLNNKRVDAATLKEGDIIALGRVALRFSLLPE